MFFLLFVPTYKEEIKLGNLKMFEEYTSRITNIMPNKLSHSKWNDIFIIVREVYDKGNCPICGSIGKLPHDKKAKDEGYRLCVNPSCNNSLYKVKGTKR